MKAASGDSAADTVKQRLFVDVEEEPFKHLEVK